MLTALSLGGLPLSLGVVSRAVPPAAPAPFSPPESHRWGRVALGTAAGSPQPRLRCGQAPVPPPLPGACTGEAVLLQGGEMAKIRGRLPGLRSAPRGTANAPCRRIARGDRGLPRGGTAGAERTEAPRPPPAGEARSASARRWAEGHAFAGGRKEKKITHMHKKCVFCARGLGGVTVSVQESWRRCQSPPPPSSRIPAPPHRPRQNRSRAPRGPGGGCRGLPPPRGKIAEIAAPGATGQSPARWGLRTARSRPLFMEESSVHMYLV